MRARIFESMGTSLAIQAMNAFTGVLLAREFGVEGRGELAAVLIWPAVVAVVGVLGLSEATMYLATQTRRPGELLGTVLVVWLVQSIVLAAVAVPVIALALSGYDDGVVNAGLAFVGYIPLFLLGLYTMAILQGGGSLRAFQALRLALVVLTAVGLVGLALTGRLHLWGAIAVYLAANAIVAAAGLTILLRRRPTLGFSRSTASALAAYGVRVHPGTVSTMLNERLDQLVISVVLGPVKLGLYVVAMTVSSLTALVGSSIGLVATPEIARLAGVERARAAARLVRLTIACSVVLTIPVLLFTEPLLTLVFGAAFGDAVGVARLLLVAALVLGTGRTLAAALKGAGVPLRASVADGCALVVTVLGLALLLPSLGLIGAGITSLLAYLVSTILLARSAARVLEVPLSSLLWRPPAAEGHSTARPATGAVE